MDVGLHSCGVPQQLGDPFRVNITQPDESEGARFARTPRLLRLDGFTVLLAHRFATSFGHYLLFLYQKVKDHVFFCCDEGGGVRY